MVLPRSMVTVRSPHSPLATRFAVRMTVPLSVRTTFCRPHRRRCRRPFGRQYFPSRFMVGEGVPLSRCHGGEVWPDGTRSLIAWLLPKHPSQTDRGPHRQKTLPTDGSSSRHSRQRTLLRGVLLNTSPQPTRPSQGQLDPLSAPLQPAREDAPGPECGT